MILLRSLAIAPDIAHDESAATLTGLVVPWGEEFERMGGVRFVFTRESLTLPDDLSTIKLLVNHDDDRPAGYALTASNDADGLRMTFALPPHPRSNDLFAEVEAGLRDGFSVGVAPDANTVDEAFNVWIEGEQVRPVTLSGVLREVSACAVPQFNSARVNNDAGTLVTLTNNMEDVAMPDPVVTPDPVGVAASRFSIMEAPEFAELAGRVSTLELGTPDGVHPLARFGSLAEVIRAGLADDADRIRLVLEDNTGNAGANEGVLPPSWASSVHGIIERRRNAVNAFGGPSALPASGMDTAWPYFDGDLSTLVGEQLTHKADIVSAAVDIKKATAAIKTYAGGADNALQLIERSDPSFLEAWGRIMLAAYAMVTEAAFTTDAYALATGSAECDTLTAEAAAVRDFLFNASDMVDDATGAPATFALAAPDVFRYWGTLDGVHNPMYGLNTAVLGTAGADTLQINVNGLPVVKARGLATGQVAVSNSDAASFREDGPSFIDALNVSKLGRDSAVYGFGVAEVYSPAGIVVAVPVVPPA